jgi:hypothetical protein
VPGTGTIYADPLFADNYLNDFHLTATSPCVGTGLDSYDIGALPYMVRPAAPSAIAATPVGVTEDCDLSWTNPTIDTDGNALASLDGVNVYRNGELLTTLSPASPGQMMNYTDTVPVSDWCRYTVSAVSAGTEGLRGSHAELWVGGDVTGILVWNLGLVKENGEAVRDAIMDRSYDDVVRLVEQPARYPLSGEVDAVFVLLGVYGWNHVLGETESQLLVDYLDAGGNVYMEGSDTWYFDVSTTVHPYFNITGVADGSADCASVRGAAGTFTDGMTFTYTGNNSYIDHLAPIGSAFTILSNVSPAYDACVAFDSGSYKTIGCSFDFAGLTGGLARTTQAELMAGMLDFFGLTGEWVDTVSVGLTCSPESGTLPFSIQLGVSIQNLVDQHRVMAAHLDMVLASGASYPNFRSGYTALDPNETFTTGWVQGLPGLPGLVGANLLVLIGQDVTPAPYNQPPYVPSGDTNGTALEVFGIHP